MDDATPERWLPVAGYEGFYEVSNFGRVRSLPRQRISGRILKPFWVMGNYRQVDLYAHGRNRRFTVHVLVMRAFAGPRPPGVEIRHLDGDPTNNRWAPGNEEETRALGGNLIYGTRAENIKDRDEKHGTNYQSNKTHCPQGHEYTPENTYRRRHGGRDCRACNRERYHRRKAA